MKSRLIFLMFVGCSLASFSKDTFTIKGKIKKSTSKKVWIYNQDKTISDTVQLNLFGSFKYSNSIYSSQLFYVKPLESESSIVLSISPKSKVKFMTTFPEILTNLSISGSSESKTLGEFIRTMDELEIERKKNEKKLYKDETADGQYFYDSILRSLEGVASLTVKTFIEENLNEPILLISALDYLDFKEDYEELVSIEKGIRKEYKSSAVYKRVKTAIYKYEMGQQKVTKIGQQAPILILPGVNGEDVSMADLKGSYILIDFWASWCKPCRAEHPRLNRLYEHFHGKGFEIYSIALDKSKQKWINAIKQDKLNWTYHVSNLSMFDSPATKIYDVKAIPFNVLVDWEGNVIAFNLRGQKLEDKLNQLFNDEY